MTSHAPAADRVNLTCKVCGHTALASAALAQHRLSCPNCGEPLPTSAAPTPATTAAGAAPSTDPPVADVGASEPEIVRRPAVWPARLIGGGAIVAVLACIGGVWYLLAKHEDPMPPYDPVTNPIPIRQEFGKDMPVPKMGKRSEEHTSEL